MIAALLVIVGLGACSSSADPDGRALSEITAAGVGFLCSNEGVCDAPDVHVFQDDVDANDVPLSDAVRSGVVDAIDGNVVWTSDNDGPVIVIGSVRGSDRSGSMTVGWSDGPEEGKMYQLTVVLDDEQWVVDIQAPLITIVP